MNREQDISASSTERSSSVGAIVRESAGAPLRRPSAAVIVNADDWGCTAEITGRILECILHGVVSSTSAMVFMADSERAAALARIHNVDAGLHLNLTTAFSDQNVPPELIRQQQKLTRFLRSNRYAPVLFHPLLASSFEYVVKRQLDEYQRLYGVPPARIDGHHHMHLSTNVLMQKLLPSRTIARRNFTFGARDKGRINRLYRGMQDRVVGSRHFTTDYFYDLVPMEPERLSRILETARRATVEIEAHPGRTDEYEFLMRRVLFGYADDLQIARGYHLRRPASDAVSLAAGGDVESGGGAETGVPHIAVCICTYMRPQLLKRLLADIGQQRTENSFTYSIVVADNDEGRSAEPVIEEMRRSLPVPVKYCVEPARGIARARNKVIGAAEGDYLAFIDDDEFPEPDWLLNLLRTCRRYDVAGVLGPVKRCLEPEAPHWLRKSSLYDREVNPNGLEVKWRESRTGNVLLKRAIISGDAQPFRPEFRAGEDQDFFRRKMEQGLRFVWSGDAVVHEVLPRARWKRSYYVRKALLQGANAALQPDCGVVSILKSAIAAPLYVLALPLALLAGQHRFMTVLVKLCDHSGKLLGLMKINPIREEYVSD